MPLRDPVAELQLLADHSTAALEARFEDLTRAIFVNDPERMERAEARLASLLADTMTLADLMGRRRVFLEADRLASEGDGAVPPLLFDEGTPVIPGMTFTQAIEQLTTREPRLAVPVLGEPRWKAVSRIYREQHAFAIARSTSETLTQRVQRLLAKSLRENVPRPTTEEAIRDLGPFTHAYTETVYRTNLASAYNAGRLQQVKDPAVRRVVGAFEYNAVLDPDVRQNHRAAHGLLAATSDDIWQRLAPPLGYNCRCSLRFVTRSELSRRRLVGDDGSVTVVRPRSFSLARPDEGFGGGGSIGMYRGHESTV